MARNRKAGPGNTIPGLARKYRAYNLSESKLRRAEKKRHFRTVDFGGLKIITPSEERRICDLLEIPLKDDEAESLPT